MEILNPELLNPELPKQMLPLAFACSVPAGNEVLAKDLMLQLKDEGRGSSVGKRDARNFFLSLERIRMLRDVGNFCSILGLYVLRFLRRNTVCTLEIDSRLSGGNPFLDFTTRRGIVMGRGISFLISNICALNRMKTWFISRFSSAFSNICALNRMKTWFISRFSSATYAH